MNPSHVLIAVALCLVAGVALVLGRWEVSIGNDNVLVTGYKLDRWTGNVYFVDPASERKVTED